MKLLLDTATILWISSDSPKLSAAARTAYLDTVNERFVSVASLWEIIVKNRLGKLPLGAPIAELIDPMKQSGLIHVIPLSEAAVYRLQSLPDIHRDPFDRMLVCQAMEDGLTLVTPDPMIMKYPVSTLW